MGYSSAVDVVLEVIVSGVTGLVSGVMINAMAVALSNVEPSYSWLVGLVLLVIIPIIGAFSDTEQMIVRGAFYCLAVMMTSLFIFNDVAEAGLAVVALVLTLILSYYKNNDSGW